MLHDSTVQGANDPLDVGKFCSSNDVDMYIFIYSFIHLFIYLFICLFVAPVVRHDAFYALLFCLSGRVYVYISPRLSRGSTGGAGGVLGEGVMWGGLNSVLSPSSCCIFVSTRSRCHAL